MLTFDELNAVTLQVYGTDPQADAQPGDQCADTDGRAKARDSLCARIAELEAEVARPRPRLSATWEHLPDVTARPSFPARALRFSR